MLKNYLTTAFRNLRKNSVFSLINIVGLAIGLACVMVIVSYVRLEMSYDQQYENSQNIYRVAVEWEDDGQRVNTAMNHAPLAPIIKEQLPGVIHTVRIFPYPTVLSIDKQNRIKEKGFVFADSTFFDVFSGEVVSGSLKNALDGVGSVVLTKSAAIKHFGSTDVVGKEMFYEDERREITLSVTSVVEDFPQNSHFHPEIIGSFATVESLMPWYNNWHHPPMYIYLETNGSLSSEELNETIGSAVFDHLPDYVQAEKRNFHLQPVTDIHLNSSLENEWETNASSEFVKLFVIIALFILMIASINFMNLATARSAQRAKEVGMRKVLGANRKQLIWQFLGESFVTTVIAISIAFGLAELVLIHAFNNMIGKELTITFLASWPYFGYVILGALILSLISGLYPAFYISAHQPSRTLKGEKSSGGGLNIRRGMVTFQFFISSLLIIGTLVVLNQTNFLRNKRLGFDQEHIIAVRMGDDFAQRNYQVLKDQLLFESTVENVGLSSTVPGMDNFYGFETFPEGISADKEYSLKTLGVDEDFLSTYNIKLVEGRGFSKDIISDQRKAFILNEAAVEKLNWKEPVGKDFGLTVYTGDDEIRIGKVIGVVENFHFESLYKDVEPLVIYINKHRYYSDYLSVKFKAGNISESVKTLEKKWKTFNPERPIEYYFLDEELDQLYKTEIKRSELFTAFATLSIIISCLGLFGLSAFSAQQRTKEIGIRKVLGASIASILRLLSKEYMILIIIANVLAIPLAWYYANQWLTNYAFRIEIEPWVFAISLVMALMIALLTVSYQALKAAFINPVKSLKDE